MHLILQEQKKKAEFSHSWPQVVFADVSRRFAFVRKSKTGQWNIVGISSRNNLKILVVAHLLFIPSNMLNGNFYIYLCNTISTINNFVLVNNLYNLLYPTWLFSPFTCVSNESWLSFFFPFQNWTKCFQLNSSVCLFWNFLKCLSLWRNLILVWIFYFAIICSWHVDVVRYPAINKPAGVVHWLKYSEDADNVDWVVILDADMIIRGPIIPWELGAEKGRPVAAYYG